MVAAVPDLPVAWAVPVERRYARNIDALVALVSAVERKVVGSREQPAQLSELECGELRTSYTVHLDVLRADVLDHAVAVDHDVVHRAVAVARPVLEPRYQVVCGSQRQVRVASDYAGSKRNDRATHDSIVYGVQS